MSNWEDKLNEEQAAYLKELRQLIEMAREDLLRAKTTFDRLCDDLYLFSRKMREENTS
jgi:hypothetical protein